MKKWISLFLILLLIFSFSACRKNPTQNSSGVPEKPNKVEESVPTEIIDEQPEEEQNEIPIVDVTEKPTPKPEPEKSSQELPSTPETPSKPVKTQPNFGPMVVDINGKKFSHLIEKVPYYQITLPGTIVDYFEINDYIYIAFSESNLLNVYNALDGTIVISKELQASPREIKFRREQIWLLLSSGEVLVFDKDSLNLINSYRGIRKQSFDIYGDYIYSTGGEYIERYNILTKESEYMETLIPTVTGVDNYWHEACILIDQANGIIYIGESGYTGSELCAFDLNTLELINNFDKFSGQMGYGVANGRRRIILHNGYIYWYTAKIHPNEMWHEQEEYPGPNFTGMLYADDDYVITTEGIFENSTARFVVKLGDSFVYNSKERVNALITESKNIMIADHKTMYIFY